MCGIAGFLIQNSQLKKEQAKDILAKMCRSIQHRGPDDHGIYLSGFDNRNSTFKGGLGHNRLSIIDLSSAGHQPMTNEDNSIWLTYNGEIYNFLELRELLIKKGHVFRSKTDSEVIIHSWEQWQQECVNKFNGMFAFALWDQRKKILMLARDRMGQKPIYYSVLNKNIIFASEPKAILRFPNFTREIAPASLKKYFLYEYVPSPHTIYKGIKRLEAGNLLIWQNGNISIKRYWNISFAMTDNSKNINNLKTMLKDSVEKRLISDVPLGVFLSGGIDSSTIANLLTEILPPEHIKTYTIGFEDKSFDESIYASEVSNYFKTAHYERILEPNAMLDIIPEVISFLDEPFADASIIATYLLSKFTREHVKVALGGDGGDELLAGYDTFQAHKLARIYEKIPSFIKKYFIEKIIRHLPVSFANLSFDFRLKQFLKGIPFKPEIRNQIWLGSFSPEEQEDLLQRDISQKSDSIYEDIFSSLACCDARNYIELIMYLYCKFYLQDDILIKIDRASMACSLEARAPFLDYRFVEFVNGIPANFKLRGFKTKYILKKSMKGHLPRKIINRPKKGFGIPVARWLRKDLKDLLIDELSFDKIKKENILSPSYVQTLLNEHFSGIKDNRKQLWTILIFELWYKKWILDK